jgi:hypothetical protein
MAEIEDKKLRKIEKRLNSAMREFLYGGGGDAGWSELSGAATCFETLKLLGLKVRGEKDIRRELEGENVYSDNFIKGL